MAKNIITNATVNSVNSASTATVTFTEVGPVTFDDAVYKLMNEIGTMIINKQKDYGQDNILQSPFGAEQGIIVRMWDKMARIKHLVVSTYDPQHESIEDSYRDMIGYAVLALMFKNGWFTLPLKRDNGV